MTNPRLIATAVAGLAVGALVGYKYAEHKLVREFEERLDKETNQLRRMYKPGYENPKEMVEKLHGEEAAEALREYAPEEPNEMPADVVTSPVAYHKIKPSKIKVEEKEEEKPIERRIFEVADDRGEIYVISAAENAADEAGYENVTWTYYAKDGVVTDIHEDVIEDVEKFIGNDALTSWGRFTDEDANVVYVRNEITMIDYEIVRSEGAYVEEVLQEVYEPPVQRPSQRIQGS